MIFHKRKKNHDKQRTSWRKSKILIFDERKKCLDIVIVKQRRRKKNPYLVKTISWRNLGSKAPRGVRAFYGLVETKLITRRGCGDSVSTPSADEGRLFIKSHVSRVPRRPINSPWRFLLWPPTDFIHISCRSTPSPRVFTAVETFAIFGWVLEHDAISSNSWSFLIPVETSPTLREGVK